MEKIHECDRIKICGDIYQVRAETIVHDQNMWRHMFEWELVHGQI